MKTNKNEKARKRKKRGKHKVIDWRIEISREHKVKNNETKKKKKKLNARRNKTVKKET